MLAQSNTKAPAHPPNFPCPLAEQEILFVAHVAFAVVLRHGGPGSFKHSPRRSSLGPVGKWLVALVKSQTYRKQLQLVGQGM